MNKSDAKDYVVLGRFGSSKEESVEFQREHSSLASLTRMARYAEDPFPLSDSDLEDEDLDE